MIVIPFRDDFETRMTTGQKTATTRTKKYGNPGDLFRAFNHTFELTNVDSCYLQDVASVFYQQEGFKTQQEFIECWKEIHPRKGYQYDQKVWLHQFRRVN